MHVWLYDGGGTMSRAGFLMMRVMKMLVIVRHVAVVLVVVVVVSVCLGGNVMMNDGLGGVGGDVGSDWDSVAFGEGMRLSVEVVFRSMDFD